MLEKKFLLPGKLVHILRVLHKGTKRAVGAHGEMSGEFDIIVGMRQEDALAPVLFNHFSDAVITATMSIHPSASVRMLYSLEGLLVGSRRKMRGKSLSLTLNMRMIWAW